MMFGHSLPSNPMTVKKTMSLNSPMTGPLLSQPPVLLILEAMHMQRSPWPMCLQQQVVILLDGHGDNALGLRLITMNPILLRDERKEKGKSLREQILSSRPCGATWKRFHQASLCQQNNLLAFPESLSHSSLKA